MFGMAICGTWGGLAPLTPCPRPLGMPLPNGYKLCRRYFHFGEETNMCTGPIFTKFSGQVHNYMGGHDQSHLLLGIAQEMLL